MFDYKPTLQSELDKILPTYYELFVDSSTDTPCITYIESNNIAAAEGDTLRYSTLSYQIKIWGDDIEELSRYAQQLDSTMYALGFRRITYNELWYNTQCQLIFRYEATALEKN